MTDLPTVCVALSGGVDSTVAALLLQEQGYPLIGAFMKNWSVPMKGVGYTPWEEEAKDAEAVCKRLGIPFHIFDFEHEYQERVVQSFVSEYQRGRTPNPDVLCNKEVKFDLFLKRAQKEGADLIATGHYAQVTHDTVGYHLLSGLDTNKDQSYFLYTLTEKELSRVLFPIGHLTKPQVREIALKKGLPNATKKDSQGICFIGPVTMRTFLQHYIVAKQGNVVTPEGEVIGRHDGVMFYTEGQRHGFDTRGSHVPLFVAHKDVIKNELVVVPHDHPMLLTQSITAEQWTWVFAPPQLPVAGSARVRYRQPLHFATIGIRAGNYAITFDQPIHAVAIGQSVVCYKGEEVLGGGVIAQKL